MSSLPGAQVRTGAAAPSRSSRVDSSLPKGYSSTGISRTAASQVDFEHYFVTTRNADMSGERRTDEPAHPAIDTGYRRDAGAGDPGGTALRPESHERDRRRAGQFVGNR